MGAGPARLRLGAFQRRPASSRADVHATTGLSSRSDGVGASALRWDLASSRRDVGWQTCRRCSSLGTLPCREPMISLRGGSSDPRCCRPWPACRQPLWQPSAGAGFCPRRFDFFVVPFSVGCLASPLQSPKVTTTIAICVRRAEATRRLLCPFDPPSPADPANSPGGPMTKNRAEVQGKGEPCHDDQLRPRRARTHDGL